MPQNFFGKNLEYLRTKSGKTQSELAPHIGKGQTTIGNWERGISQPSIEELLSLSNFFAISIEELVATDLTSPHPLPSHKKKIIAEKTFTTTQHPSNELIYKDETISTMHETIRSMREMIDLQKEMIEMLKKVAT